MGKKRPAIERLMEKVRLLDSGCWEWTHYVEKNGYAKLWVDGANEMAHRFSYTHHVGPIPEGLQIDHLCRNRACVNPAHLEPVTPSENVRRGTGAEAKRDAARRLSECPQGHPYGSDDLPRRCLTCKRQKSRESYERNREITISRAREWRLANPERARQLSREGQRRQRAKRKGVAA